MSDQLVRKRSLAGAPRKALVLGGRRLEWQPVASSSERPVLVDFWASWCGPCKAQAPILDQLAASVGDRAMVAKLDVDDAPEVAAELNIRSIPTLVVLRHGRETARFVGLQSAATLAAALEAAV